MDSSYSGDAAGGAAAAGILGFIFVIWLIMLAVLVVALIGLMKVFVKAGRPGWAAFVPIYNIYMLIEIVGRPTWWLALLLVGFIPGIGQLALIAVLFVLYWDLAKSFGKDIGFAIGLTLLSPVFLPMLGFGPAQYIGPMASGFGLPDTPGGGMAGGGYVPPAQSYTPPAPTYTPPAPTYTPPAPPTAPAPTYTPPAPPAAPAAPPASPAPPTEPPVPPQS